MKRKLVSLFMATTLALTSASIVCADDAAADSGKAADEATTEATTEPTSEETTEPTTEATTEATTAAPTTEKSTEATTSSATTTTQKDDTNTIGDTIAISLDGDDTKSLSKYIDGDIKASDLSWSSDDKDVCKVSSSGKITAKKKGSCVVTAEGTINGTKYKYTFNVKVKNTSKDGNYDDTFTIYDDETLNLYKKTYVNVDDYDSDDYEWESSAKNVATVDKYGKVTAKREGYTIIDVTSDDNEEEYSFKVTVKDSDSYSSSSSSNSSSSSSNSSSSNSSTKTASIKTAWDIYMEEDSSFDLEDVLEDSADDYDWDVDDDEIADVNENTGKLSSGEEGSTKITAKGDRNYTFTVRVSDDYSNDEASLKVGESKSLESYLDDDVEEYSFSVGGSNAVSVNSNGKITGNAKGVAYVVCKHDNGDVIQIFVNVSGGTTTPTTESTTEATTQATTKPAYAPTQPAAPSSKTVSFTDISDRPWAVEAINAMAAKDIIHGVGNNKFSPDTYCKRCDFAIVLINMMGLNSEIAESNYEDIPFASYYYNYVGIAKKHGIESGVNGASFYPLEDITREDIMVMTYKALVDNGQTFNTDTSVLAKYTDAGKLREESRIAVAALVNSGAVTGTSDTTLEPTSKITRAQMAVLMNNVLPLVNSAL